MGRSAGTWVSAGAAVLVTAAFLAVAVRAWLPDLRLLDYPFVLDYGEGVLVSQAGRLAEGLPLYPETDLGGPGFVGANYPPLYYLALRVLPDDPDSLYADGRLLSFASYLLLGLLAGLLLWRATGIWLAGLVAGATVLALPPAHEWAMFAKPDLLALALSTAGLAVAVLAPRRVLLAAPFFALALLTKQTTVAAPLAVGLALLLTPSRRRQAFGLAGLVAALTLAPLLLLEAGPDAVFWHLLAANVRGWAWDRFDAIGLMFLEICRALLPAVLVSLVLAWRRRPIDPLVIYVGLALLTLLAAGAPGSSRNYAIEAGLGLAIAAGLAYAWLQQHPWRWAAAARLLLIGLLGWQAATFWVLPERAYGRRRPTNQATAGRENLLHFLTSTTHGPVLSEDPGLLLQAELPIEYYDPSLMQKLADAGVWDETLLIEQIQQHHFSVILTEVDLEREPERAGRWSAATVAAIRQHYRLLYRDVLMVWVPRELGWT